MVTMLQRAREQTGPSHQDPPKNGWIEGLDLARAGAIFLVVWVHGLDLLPERFTRLLNPPFLMPGWWGVRIFFAISGYLIGRQILSVMAKRSRRGALTFLLRRWLRTVPTYWLVLLLVLALDPTRWLPADILSNALFLQSIAGLDPSLLAVAWSLVIEEWSYLVVGLAALLVVVATRRRAIAPPRILALGSLSVLLGVIALGGALRLAYVTSGSPNWAAMKKVLVLQPDSLAYGALLAVVAHFAPHWFTKITAPNRWSLILCGLAMAGESLLVRRGLPLEGLVGPMQGWCWLAIAGYPLAGVLSTWLLIALWPFRYAWIDWRLAVPIQMLAKISYSLYLLHLPLVQWLHQQGEGIGVFVLYLLLSIILGWLGWLALERPFITLRAKMH